MVIAVSSCDYFSGKLNDAWLCSFSLGRMALMQSHSTGAAFNEFIAQIARQC
jgi:hypothetical protein